MAQGFTVKRFVTLSKHAIFAGSYDVVPFSTTLYLGPVPNWVAAPVESVFILPVKGIIKDLRFEILTNSINAGGHNLTIYINTASSSITVPIGQNSTGPFSELVTAVPVNAGDILQFVVTTSGSSGTIVIPSISLLLSETL